MKLSLLFLTILSGSLSFASSDEPKQYKRGQCIESLVEILGSNFKAVSRDTITRREKDGSLTVMYSSGTSVRVQPNGGCYPLKNKADDYSGAMISAYNKAREAYKKSLSSKKELKTIYAEAIEVCDAQEKGSGWYKLVTELAPKLESPSGLSR